MGRFTGILGLLTMLGLAYAFSTNRRAIRLKTVAWGLGLQFVFAVFVLKIEAGAALFQKAGDAVNEVAGLLVSSDRILSLAISASTDRRLASSSRSEYCPPSFLLPHSLPFSITTASCSSSSRSRRVIMTRVMGASGAESLNVAASIFMGQTEAPLTIRPFLPDLTRSELMTVMTSGMAHVSGGIMAAYISFGIEPKHLLSAVIMTAPGTMLMAKMLVPETEQPKTAGRVVMNRDEEEQPRRKRTCLARSRAAQPTACTWR